MDMFSQANMKNAQSLLLFPTVTTSTPCRRHERLLPTMERADIIRVSLATRGAMIVTRDLAEAVAVSNRLAPEHLELSVADPAGLLSLVRHAGAIFMGPFTSEAVGDTAGPNHAAYLSQRFPRRWASTIFEAQFCHHVQRAE
jgi:histidinol dehydrogenase